MDKKVLRQEMKQRLAKMDKPEYEDKSFAISQKLFQAEDWIQATTVGVTISNPPEVDTYQIIRKAWELGKTVVVPKCEPETKRLQFRKLERFSQLERIFFGLYEPIVPLTTEFKAEEIDLLIVPGLLFTDKGYRLGFGGGYYDRFLQKYPGEKLSLAFHFQIVQNLPIEVHDLPVSKLITDIEVIKVND